MSWPEGRLHPVTNVVEHCVGIYDFTQQVQKELVSLISASDEGSFTGALVNSVQTFTGDDFNSFTGLIIRLRSILSQEMKHESRFLSFQVVILPFVGRAWLRKCQHYCTTHYLMWAFYGPAAFFIIQTSRLKFVQQRSMMVKFTKTKLYITESTCRVDLLPNNSLSLQSQIPPSNCCWSSASYSHTSWDH